MIIQNNTKTKDKAVCRFLVGFLLCLPVLTSQSFGAVRSIPRIKTGPKLGAQKSCHLSAAEPSLRTSTNCQAIIEHFEKQYGIPDKLLTAIASVESKKSPWAVNAQCRSHFFSKKEDAVSHIKKLQSQGVKNINVGCMQINLPSHGKKFKSIDEAVTPFQNISYAAKLVRHLYDHHGSWEKAVKYYHSDSPHHNVSYKKRVFSVWEKHKQRSAAPLPAAASSHQAPGQTFFSVEPLVTQAANNTPVCAVKKNKFIRVAFGPGAGMSKIHPTKG
ncbi:MAG: transglycosylase SLT domain-containing protein [Alphaproteobacteria bacterium]|nr:transglycosylase SLT domain-containing protein [Alphaproteobacteria bacterium]